MTSIGDSRSTYGPGILPLRHRDYGKDKWLVSQRASVLGIRIRGRIEKPGLEPGVWKYKHEDDLYDINHLLIWPSSRGHRGGLSSGSWAYPAIVTIALKKKFRIKKDSAKIGGDMNCRPMSADGHADTRFVDLLCMNGQGGGLGATDKNTQIMPKDQRGIVVCGSDEDHQQGIFFASGMKLIAANFGGHPRAGSIVFDLEDGDDSIIDPERAARLQSMMRVVKLPVGIAPVGYPPELDQLSWNIGPSGQRDGHGGFVTDILPAVEREDTSFGFDTTIITVVPESTVHANVSRQQGGFLDVGDPDLPDHKIGEDADGNTINPAYIAMNALYRDKSSRKGPLHEEDDIEPGGHWPIKTKVTFGFHKAAPYKFLEKDLTGKWIWRGEAPYQNPEPPPGGGGVPAIPGGGGGSPGGHVDRQDFCRSLGFAAFGMAVGHATMLGWPQHYLQRGRDYRYGLPTGEEYESQGPIRPVTYREDSFGAERGLRWDYIDKPGKRHAGGTAQGGMFVTPPQMPLEHYYRGYRTKTGVGLAFRIYGPDAALAFGLPDQGSGHLASGWKVQINQDGRDLEWTPTDQGSSFNVNGNHNVFDFHRVSSVDTITIPSKQQMSIHGLLTVEAGGVLAISPDGQLAVRP